MWNNQYQFTVVSALFGKFYIGHELKKNMTIEIIIN